MSPIAMAKDLVAQVTESAEEVLAHMSARNSYLVGGVIGREMKANAYMAQIKKISNLLGPKDVRVVDKLISGNAEVLKYLGPFKDQPINELHETLQRGIYQQVFSEYTTMRKLQEALDHLPE